MGREEGHTGRRGPEAGQAEGPCPEEGSATSVGLAVAHLLKEDGHLSTPQVCPFLNRLALESFQNVELSAAALAGTAMDAPSRAFGAVYAVPQRYVAELVTPAPHAFSTVDVGVGRRGASATERCLGGY